MTCCSSGSGTGGGARELGPWDAASARAGLHPAAMEFVADRQVAILGSDSNNDAAGSVAEQVDFPVHVLAINALGVQLLDYLEFAGPGRRLRAGGPLVVPVRHRAAAAARRDRITGQSHRHPVAPSSGPASRCQMPRCALSPAAPTATRITTFSSSW